MDKLYSSVSIIIIATNISTTMASNYALYNSVFLSLENLLYSVINALCNNSCYLIEQKTKNHVWLNKLNLYLYRSIVYL